ncbi:F0F1 ATP synthase subunit delta [Schleiferilactobacillus harbinensis]|uniref:ATP synthase F1 subunit delta n=1 Tax=Schleiferilactobacillus harbinensis TaxID=304207 RepID=UPI0021A3524A|nr:ATP synthase F1 subunit delta [Schleiferilactobacillus harbinensis]MCT2907083.1 F0F1 ATP synthase subunit delta [Schleiferilactobacillus harbinensis]
MAKLDRGTVGTRYATALLALAKERGNAAETLDELRELAQVFAAQPDLGQILTDNRLSLQEKQPILAELKKPFSEQTQTLLQMVYDYKRMVDMPDIVKAYEHLYDADQHIIEAHVTSIVPLTADQQTALKQALAARFGAKTVYLHLHQDPALIGGVVVRVHDTVLDGSMARRLADIKAALTAAS